jgi:bifunctional DNase/RNase
MLKMSIVDIKFSLFDNSAIIILKGDEEKVLLLTIGVSEARSIVHGLSNENQASRPLSHDLMLDILKISGLKLREVVIEKIEKGTFYAYLKLFNNDGLEIILDSRPSDAIALAVREDVDINVTREVYEKASTPIVYVSADKKEEINEVVKEESSKFNEFINKISPEDFAKYGKEKLHLPDGNVEE